MNLEKSTMNLEKLREMMLKAKLENKNIALELTVPNSLDTEIIIVKNRCIDFKLNYYIENYSKDLTLNRCKYIKIINACIIDNYLTF